MYGSIEQAFVGRDEPKNGCEGGYDDMRAIKIRAISASHQKFWKLEKKNVVHTREHN